MDARAEIVREDEGRIDQVQDVTQPSNVDPAISDPALPDARRDHRFADAHSLSVPPSPYSVARKRRRGGQSFAATQPTCASPSTLPAKPESRLGQNGPDTHRGHAEAATTHPGDAGRESGHSERDTQTSAAALANDPSQDGAGEGHLEDDTQAALASLAKVRKPRGVRGAVGHVVTDTHNSRAGSAKPIGSDADDPARQTARDIQQATASGVIILEIGGDAEGEVGQTLSDAQFADADLATIKVIREFWRRRQAWHRAEKSLTLQAKAMCRGLVPDGNKEEANKIYDAATGKGAHDKAVEALVLIGPIVGGRKVIEVERVAVERSLAKLAKRLPVAPWIESTYGVAIPSLAALVGEAGDLSVYSNPAKLWKRMGLAVMPDGTRQQKRAGDGYSPNRRSVVWNVGGGLIGGMGRGPRLMPGEDPDGREDLSPLQRVFVKRLRYEAERDPAHVRPVTAGGKESFSKHAANRAKRYVEKRFLLLLWREWRRVEGLSPRHDEITDLRPLVGVAAGQGQAV